MMFFYMNEKNERSLHLCIPVQIALGRGVLLQTRSFPVTSSNAEAMPSPTGLCFAYLWEDFHLEKAEL